jgi:hypothetical protein
MSKLIRHTNAFICYRKDNIDHGSKLKMTDYSRLIAPKWQDESDLRKRKYYQAAAKDYVEKEIASGGNGTTVKSFEQFGNIAFVNEMPIKKYHNVDHRKESINDDELFNEFTINSDFYVQEPIDINVKRVKQIENIETKTVTKKRTRNHYEEKSEKLEKSSKLKLKYNNFSDHETFEESIININCIFKGVPLFDLFE